MRRGASRRVRGLAGPWLCVLALAAALSLAGAAAPAAAAGPPGCAGGAMYVVAHQDDSLLFQSPDLLEDIREGRCVRTVFLTAGDDGEGEAYWITREEGAEAAYAQMAGMLPSAAWTPSTETVPGAVNHPIRFETLTADPRLTLVFMRLPDGSYPAGEGTPLYGMQSLMKLWNGGNAALPAESSIGAVDGSTSYEYEDLTATLAALMTSFEPQWIATQNYTGSFGNGDHPDHVATAKFAKEAQADYAAPHRLTAYEDYETSSLSVNVSGELLDGKEAAFEAYEAHDEACTEGASCEELYEGWLKRQYVAAGEMVGDPTPSADAGPAQAVASSANVTLDGSNSVNPYQQPLDYEWTQTGGPPVVLSDPTDPMPSFAAPSGPASLAFSLVVSNPLASSEPATATVTVKPEPEPARPPASPASPPPASPADPVRPRLSQRRVELFAGRRSRRVVSVLGPEHGRIWCTGRLPRGVTRRVVGKRRIVLESTRRAREVGAYRLIVHVAGEGGTIRRPLTVRLLRPGRQGRRGRS